MQIPTPTPFPMGTTPIDVSFTSSYSLWMFADDAVQWWNSIVGDKTQIVQIVIIAMIALFSVFMLVRRIRYASSGDSQSADE